MSRDVIESEPAYQYVRGNPINTIDAGGLYGFEVHHGLTHDLVIDVATELGLEVDKEELADRIADGNQHVDDAVGVLDAVVGCNRCHFQPYIDSKDRVLAAMETKNLYLFGATLHLYQDFWSHWHEGYDTIQTFEIPVMFNTGLLYYVKFEGYEHLTHSAQQSKLVFFVKDVAASFEERSQDTINEFFESYPRETVRTEEGSEVRRQAERLYQQVMDSFRFLEPTASIPIVRPSELAVDEVSR